MRSLRGPAFFPIRLLAVIFTDVFRGIPLILLILLLGFGVPALDISGLPNSMASSSSKPKLWVQTARASTNDPRSVVRFIERRLLNDGTIELAQSPVRPDHAAATLALDSASAAVTLDRFPPAVRLPGRTFRVCDYG
jgi:ABC-type amino acid transport system permease subunit